MPYQVYEVAKSDGGIKERRRVKNKEQGVLN
jgi:hypothetical protein